VLQRKSGCRRNTIRSAATSATAPSLRSIARDCARRPYDRPRTATLVVSVTIHNHKRQKSAESEMAFLVKEESMPPDKRSVDREVIYGTALWADVRARLADTD
jgi:hypothetical protein